MDLHELGNIVGSARDRFCDNLTIAGRVFNVVILDTCRGLEFYQTPRNSESIYLYKIECQQRGDLGLDLLLWPTQLVNSPGQLKKYSLKFRITHRSGIETCITETDDDFCQEWSTVFSINEIITSWDDSDDSDLEVLKSKFNDELKSSIEFVLDSWYQQKTLFSS